MLPPLAGRVIASRVLSGGSAVVQQTDAGLKIFVAPSDRQDPDTIVVLQLQRP